VRAEHLELPRVSLENMLTALEPDYFFQIDPARDPKPGIEDLIILIDFDPRLDLGLVLTK